MVSERASIPTLGALSTSLPRRHVETLNWARIVDPSPFLHRVRVFTHNPG